MKFAKPVPSFRRSDGRVKEVLTVRCSQKNFRRIFLNQALPVLNLFANRKTKILLFLLENTDANNMIYCTYQDIQKQCGINDKKIISSVLRELQEARVIATVSQSHYMLNPAIMVQGNNQKFGFLANQFNQLPSLKNK